MTTILCVEDEELLREDIAEEVEDAGYQVLQAYDGQNGLEMILEHKPDLVISDITMPNMNGHELVKTLRKDHPEFADTPFIFLSALTDRDAILEGLELGADDYLTKPVDFDLLLAKIESRIKQIEGMNAKKQQELVHMAHHDALTGLPNRLLLRERLEQAVLKAARGQDFAVHCLDLDKFKYVNDTFGHPVGDELLIAVTKRLQDCVREVDTIARMGGDEFTIIQILGEDSLGAATLAERICKALCTPFDINENLLNIGTSIGIALAPADGDDVDQLISKADLALYDAKDNGRGTFRFFGPEMNSRMQERRALESDLRKALGNDEFEIHYQPLVNLKDDKVTGFEALLRWNHPERGLVAPDAFISIAEEMGLISAIGEWVLNKACAQAVTWPGEMKIAVNLSPAQFVSGNLVLLVVNALAASGLAATRLELEITESLLLKDCERNLSMLHQLRDLGVRVAMDDFGIGYSSLSYLKSFPFDKIKIDQSFISDLSLGDDNIQLIKAVTGMASALGMVTTAEGVETKEQMEIVLGEGCTEMQGYLFSSPKTAEEIARTYFPQLEAKTESAA